ALSDSAPRLSLSALPDPRAGGAPAGLGRGAPGVVECGPRTTAPVSGARGSPALGLRPDQPADRVAGGCPVVGRGAPQRLRAGTRGARCRVAAVLPAAGSPAPVEEEGAGPGGHHRAASARLSCHRGRRRLPEARHDPGDPSPTPRGGPEALHDRPRGGSVVRGDPV